MVRNQMKAARHWQNRWRYASRRVRRSENARKRRNVHAMCKRTGGMLGSVRDEPQRTGTARGTVQRNRSSSGSGQRRRKTRWHQASVVENRIHTEPREMNVISALRRGYITLACGYERTGRTNHMARHRNVDQVTSRKQRRRQRGGNVVGNRVTRVVSGTLSLNQNRAPAVLAAACTTEQAAAMPYNVRRKPAELRCKTSEIRVGNCTPPGVLPSQRYQQKAVNRASAGIKVGEMPCA